MNQTMNEQVYLDIVIKQITWCIYILNVCVNKCIATVLVYSLHVKLLIFASKYTLYNNNMILCTHAN